MNNPYYVYLFDWIKTWIINSCRIQRHWLRQQQDNPYQDEASIKHLTDLDAAYRHIEQAASSPQSSIGDLDSYLHKVLRAQSKYEQYLRARQGTSTSKIVPTKHGIQVAQVDDPIANIQRVPIGQHKLPPLPYPYNALEPYIDETTMRIHHVEHHKKYVEDLNKAEIQMEQARKTNNFELIKHWEREAAFNGAGHYLHTIFWEVMEPNGGGEPTGFLAKQIKKDFGGFSAFKNHFSAAAEKVEGGGWAILVWRPRAGRLEILQAEKHQNLSQWDIIPLLPLDVWEHAYYLKYQNRRKEYIKNWWNVVNWDAVKKRFHTARKVTWIPY